MQKLISFWLDTIERKGGLARPPFATNNQSKNTMKRPVVNLKLVQKMGTENGLTGNRKRHGKASGALASLSLFSRRKGGNYLIT